MAAGAAVRKNFVGDMTHCRKCNCEIIVTEQMTKRGTYVCRKCLSRASVERAKRNPNQKRRANKRYEKTEKGRAAIRKKTRAFRRKYPQKYAAHVAVQTAVRNGSLIPQPCETCGCKDTNGHHDDYGKPLDVRWLCDQCHLAEHAMLAERAKTEAKPK